MVDGTPMTRLTIKEAAAHFGVSERTIQRWIAAGQLQPVERVPMEHGLQVFIHVDDTPDVTADVTIDSTPDTAIVTGDTQADQGRTPVVTGDIGLLAVLQTELERVHEDNRRVHEDNRRLHDQALQLAGQVGYLQAELQQAREQIRLLTMAKNEPELPAEPPQPVEQPPKRAPWWRRWFAEI